MVEYNKFRSPEKLKDADDDRDIIGIFSKSEKHPSELSIEDINDLMIVSDNATTFKNIVSTNKQYKLLLWSYLDDYNDHIYSLWLNGVKFKNIVSPY
jgi:hypothetical protein